MKYTAIATLEGKKEIITRDYPSKAKFIDDLRRNGYKITETKVKTEEVMNHILSNTDGEAKFFRMSEREYREKYMR